MHIFQQVFYIKISTKGSSQMRCQICVLMMQLTDRTNGTCSKLAAKKIKMIHRREPITYWPPVANGREGFAKVGDNQGIVTTKEEDPTCILQFLLHFFASLHLPPPPLAAHSHAPVTHYFLLLLILFVWLPQISLLKNYLKNTQNPSLNLKDRKLSCICLPSYFKEFFLSTEDIKQQQ